MDRLAIYVIVGHFSLTIEAWNYFRKISKNTAPKSVGGPKGLKGLDKKDY
jgi:hypothetical protein